MAISWATQITNVNTVSKRADVRFTRTDDATSETWSASYTQVILETQPQRLALLDQVWAEWQAELTKQGNIAIFLGTLEQQANTNLGAREV
jgi:hypothetical protein